MNAFVTDIWRHPIKAHGREALAHILLSKGRTMPWDRRWAVAHELTTFDFKNPEWVHCTNFSRAAHAPQLQAIEARCDLHRGTVTLSHPKLKDLTIDPNNESDANTFIQWVLPISPHNRALPTRIVRAPKVGMTDTDFPSISLVNQASNTAVGAQLGAEISPTRWRPNFVMDGLEPWVERTWIGKRIKIGHAEIEVRENIKRCMATTVSPTTGQKDADTLGALKTLNGNREFGIYGVVTKTGDVRQGDIIEVL